MACTFPFSNVRIWANPCKILTEISARSLRESRQVFGQRDCQDLGEISARSRRDLKIWAAKKSPRFSPRSRQDLKISSRFSRRSWRDLKISAAKNSPSFSPRSQNLVEILPEISTRSQNLGGQKLFENLDKISSKILARSHSLGGLTSPRISARRQVRSRRDIKILEAKKITQINVSKIF